jgi:hypothetical protein
MTAATARRCDGRLEASQRVVRRYAFLARAARAAHSQMCGGPAGHPVGVGPSGPLAPALDAIEGIVGAWPTGTGARGDWLGWVVRARRLDGARRDACRAAAAGDPVDGRFVEIAGEISSCVVELYALAGFDPPRPR